MHIEGATMGFGQYIAEIKDILDRLALDSLQRICDVLYEAYGRDRTIFIFGNGGSAALASHMVCDLGKGTHCPPPGSLEMTGIRRLKAIALTDNVPLITAWGNDSAYENIFAEQMENFIQPGDIAFGISGSGNSPNVLKALGLARAKGGITVGLTGFQGGKMKDLLDYGIVVPSSCMQQIEDVHLVLAHLMFVNLRERICKLPNVMTQADSRRVDASAS